ncbi:Satratoxin biosynthesis SC1 cluster protein [Lachnellula hyalina]|uniref:Satratoxin biosynthesis SC1 cluster protein n=1 Tax=Lachnellula hyalina TaxID=1316788 RepID=A0A8H8TX04_9HELO|nr:Satratoxin biosynthesis SC1 cluster protein [Lachnellula hyalina]TVY22481.1 Satratoxin biosynthesis SC1 cluster protein [Lachnellula hyalina]
MVILVIQKGFGKHLWDINLLEASNLLKIYYVIQVLYVIVQKLLKLSILVSYLRIFPETIRWFRISIYVTIAFSAGHGTLITLLTALQCLPVASIWDTSITGKCIDVQAIIYAGTAFSIVDDILIMTLPIPCFSSLQMGRLKKISIGVMFSIGSLSCVASAIRLKYVCNYGDLTDLTWDNVDTTIWSTIEIFTAAIGACLPALRQILQRLFPKAFSIKYNTTTSGRNSYQNMSRKVPSSYLSSQPRNVNRSYPRSVNSSGGDDVANADAVGAQRLSGGWDGTELVAIHPRRLSADLKGAVVSTQGVGGMR